MMQDRMPWDEDWSQPQTASGFPTIVTPRDPRQVLREDRTDARAATSLALQQAAAERAATQFEERNKPTLPAGYMLGPDGHTAVRVPGLPADKDAETKPDLAAVRAEALDKIRLARTLQQRSRDGWFTTGFGASAVGSIGGTGAYDVRQDTETLKNAGALTRIMEMAKTNGGKNPLTPLSNSDFQALASSLSNLDTSQSDGQYQGNVQRVIDLYQRAYQGAGGTDLEGDLYPAARRRPGNAPAIGAASLPPAGTPNGSTPVYGGGGGGGHSATIAAEAYKSERDPALAGLNGKVAGMLSGGASDDAIRAFIAQSGGSADPASVNAALAFRRKHPGYKGDYSVEIETRGVPTTAWNRFAGSPMGTGLFAAVDAGLGGSTDEIAAGLDGGDLADLNARKQALFASNPKSALLGAVGGTIGGMAGLGAVARGAGVASRFSNAGLIGDLAFGAVSGAGQSNDNRLLGATLGAAGGGIGNVVGQGAATAIGGIARTRAGLGATNTARRMFGRGPVMAVARPEVAERTALGAINRAGPDNITAQLNEAQGLGLPMSLADTNPNLRELAGAAVRRSPTASSFAEDALLSRSRGQYDRFVGAVQRDLGSTTNIPQRSADLTAQARNDAGALYDQAYARSVPSTPELDAVLGTPFGRQALGRARTIAANERRSPDELGFALDADGNTVLNPRPNDAIARHLSARADLDEAQNAYRASANASDGVSRDAARQRVIAARERLRQTERALSAVPDPNVAASVPAYTTQTLDYVKRGMDDVLEEQRNPITGRLVLDEAGRAQNQVRGQLLSEVDTLNPSFAAARTAYAGPTASRDALARGVDAYGLHPDELGIQVGAQTPEHLAQMQLGYRGALVDHAGRVRDNSNPWEATLGTPITRQRLGTMYPEAPGVAPLMRSREIEGQMQQTANAVLGNSRTARNQIADQSFMESPAAQGAVDVGASMLTGGLPVATAMRVAAGRGVRDAVKLGIGRRATARANALAPMLMTPQPSAALATVQGLLAQDQAFQAFVSASRPRRLGMFGRGVGSQAALVPLNR